MYKSKRRISLRISARVLYFVSSCKRDLSVILYPLASEICQLLIMASLVEAIDPPFGKVYLSEKQFPVCETPSPHRDHYAFTRALVDVSPFKAKLDSLNKGVWEDENQEGNVRLTRPAHDAWGIKKIIFTFCDDFLLKVLDLPWSQEASWKCLLDEVYAAINVKPERVVRSLLANMPPGVKIPVHHDTGYWVKHTHRCHFAIQSGEEVRFFVGPTESEMKQVNALLLSMLLYRVS